MRRSLTTRARVGLAALVVGASALLGLGSSGAGAVAAADLPQSMHGAVETQAVTVGNGAVSLLVDPGTAYAYSTLDRDDYGEGSVNFSMTARGANLNLGTIAYAVLWAPPACATNNAPCFLSGQWVYKDGSPYKGEPPNTGLHEAKGFPGYAEALYPPPPEGSGTSQERVYKCIITKDGPGSPPTNGAGADQVCKGNDFVPMSAWAEAVAPEYRSTGFSRAAGFDVPGVLAVRGSESHSDVRPVGAGIVQSTGYSNVQGIEILGGAIKIDSVKSSSTVVSSIDGVDVKKSGASCTFSGLSVNGQGFSTNLRDLANPQLQAQLDQVAKQSGYKVEIIAPAETDVAQVDEGKFVSGCSGLQIKFTDLHTQAPIPLCFPSDPPSGVPGCVPALGNREEFSFGKISVQQAVNDLSFSFGDGSAGGSGAGAGSVPGGDFSSADGGSTLSAAAAGAAAGSGSVTDFSSASGSVSAVAAPVRSGSGSGSGSSAGSAYQYDTAGLSKAFNPRQLGALTAASGGLLLLGVMALVGVVNALAGGRPFRLPGF
ncbi:MAG TPA: hypothetical protein VGO92_10145 [Acidimicrobiales bacterium]|jgi:hypothetical protein|nr:hypothetical protein [Acidimicrobiales bacterium]